MRNRISLLKLALLKQTPINSFLQLGNTDINVNLNLGLERFLNFTLEPPQQKWTQNAVQLFNHGLVMRFFLRIGHFFLPAVRAQVEPFVEVAGGLENLGQQEI